MKYLRDIFLFQCISRLPYRIDEYDVWRYLKPVNGNFVGGHNIKVSQN
jgi:hypothetical protein